MFLPLKKKMQASIATLWTEEKGRLQPCQFRLNKMNSVSCGLEREVKKNKNIF